MPPKPRKISGPGSCSSEQFEQHRQLNIPVFIVENDECLRCKELVPSLPLTNGGRVHAEGGEEATCCEETLPQPPLSFAERAKAMAENPFGFCPNYHNRGIQPQPPLLHAAAATASGCGDGTWQQQMLSHIVQSADKSQLKGVTSDPNLPCLISAGAGSGKTRTILLRICFLIANGVPARNILGITFTRKSAESLRERIRAALPEKYQNFANDVRLKTVHAMALELLRQNSTETLDGAIPENFSVVDATKQKEIAELVILAENEGQQIYKLKEIRNALLRFVRQTKTELGKAGRVVRGNDNRDPAFYFHAYQRELHEVEKALDFDDLQLFAYQLLKTREEVLQDVRRRWTHIVVDEYQDLNSVQLELLLLIAGEAARITCVGDEHQSIYGWRGAVQRIFDTTRRRLAINKREQEVFLPLNYRSVDNIVMASSSVINRAQLAAVDAPGPFIEIRSFSSRNDMSFGIGHIIQSLRIQYPNSIALGDIAVLVRTNVNQRNVTNLVRGMGIPCRRLQQFNPTNKDAVKLLRCFVSLVCNPDDNQAFRFALTVVKMGFGAGFWTALDIARKKMINEHHSTNGCSYFAIAKLFVDTNFAREILDVPMNKATKERLKGNVELVMTHRDLLLGTPSTDITVIIASLISNLKLKGVKIKDSLQPQQSEESATNQHFNKQKRRAEASPDRNDPETFLGDGDDSDSGEDEAESNDGNQPVSELFAEISSNVKAEYPTDPPLTQLHHVADRLTLLVNSDAFKERKLNENSVTISTVHQAKGLEWPVVILFMCNEGHFPLNFSRRPAVQEEERRVFYVAMSRAQKLLILTCINPEPADDRDCIFDAFFGGSPEEVQLSQFISTIPQTLLSDASKHQFLEC